jgi:hypothetical protein
MIFTVFHGVSILVWMCGWLVTATIRRRRPFLGPSQLSRTARPDPRQQGAHVGIAQGFEDGVDRAGAGGSAQQARPPDLRLPVADEARRERADFRRPTPILDQGRSQISYWSCVNTNG